MRRQYLLAALLFLVPVPSSVRASVPFAREFEDELLGLLPTADDGMLLVVKDPPVLPSSTQACLLLKLDAVGRVQTRTPFAGTAYQPYAAVAAPDGGVVFLLDDVADPARETTIQKVPGTSGWTASTGGASAGDVVGLALDVAGDGSVAVAGRASGKPWVAKLDGTGRTVWSLTLDPASGQAQAVRFLADGGVLVSLSVACTQWLEKLDASGLPLWRQGFDEPGFAALGNALAATADGGALVAGARLDPACAPAGGFLLRLDATGAAQWRRTYVSASGRDQLLSLWPTRDGGVLFGGMTEPDFSGGGFIGKVDTAGTLVWQRGDFATFTGAVAESASGDVLALGDFLTRLPGGGFAASSCFTGGPLVASASTPSVTVSSVPTSPGPLFAADATSSVDATVFTFVRCADDCVAPPAPVTGLRAVKNLTNVVLEWDFDPISNGTDLWYVTDKTLIGLARQSGSPPAIGVGCGRPPNARACSDLDAVPRTPSVFFYQARTYCNATTEGP